MAEKRSERTIKLANQWNDGSIMLQHKYVNATFKVVDGVVRVFNKNGEMQPMQASHRKVKGRAW